MAYSSSSLQMVQPLGFPTGPNLFHYRSSDSAAEVAASGYFAAAGAGSRHASSDSDRAKGMKYADVVMAQESSAGADPGRVSMHSVIGSTADQVSTSASTGWLTGYNVTVSAHPTS